MSMAVRRQKGDKHGGCIENLQVLKDISQSLQDEPFLGKINIFVGRTGWDSCPVAVVLLYMVLRSQWSPIFVFSDGTPLTRTQFVLEVKQALAAAGVDSSHYSGHSFCSSAATGTAAK